MCVYMGGRGTFPLLWIVLPSLLNFEVAKNVFVGTNHSRLYVIKESRITTHFIMNRWKDVTKVESNLLTRKGSLQK